MFIIDETPKVKRIKADKKFTIIDETKTFEK